MAYDYTTAALTWDAEAEREYQTGVDHCVLYPRIADGTYPKGYAWNGITNITESPDGAEPQDFWADNIKYASIRSVETYGGSITAYMYPNAFKPCIGEKELAPGIVIGQQERMPFGISYRNIKGNATQKNEYGYIYHLVYGMTVGVSDESHDTTNEDPELAEFDWDYNTDPIDIPGSRPTSYMEFDTTKMDSTMLTKLDDLLAVLYGTKASGNDPAVDPRLPLPAEVCQILGITLG